MSELIRQENGSYIHPKDPGEPGYSGSSPRVSVTDEEAGIVARYCEGLIVVEFGTGLGVSTRAIGRVANDVVTIDPDPWVQANVWPHVPAERESSAADVREMAPDLYFDVAFIDGCHTRPAVDKDVADAMRLVKPGGLIIFHDWNHNDVRSAAADAGLTCHIEHKTVHGIGVARRP